MKTHSQSTLLDDEYQYLNLVDDILKNGIPSDDRTGVGTISLFGKIMRFSLCDNKIPILTTKKMYIKAIIEELLFFLRGHTDNKILKEKGIHIWNGNSSNQYYKKIGLSRDEDDLGPIYGFQWRHFGASYRGSHQNYNGEGIDQLAYILNEIKKNPNSRRLIVSTWNPLALNDMCLPPCHVLFQLRIYQNKLSCLLFQRSGDVGLGIPFNITSYSLLTLMFCKICNLSPGEFIHVIGDAHIYKNHIPALQEQIKRKPFGFPLLEFRNKSYTSFDDFEFNDFIIKNYKSHNPIKMDMAI
ncbi:MAG: thymidylate synthase [Tissierellia bacterium]|nr:thymidylate synthase [Tissierellia bacterium]